MYTEIDNISYWREKECERYLLVYHKTHGIVLSTFVEQTFESSPACRCPSINVGPTPVKHILDAAGLVIHIGVR